MPLLQPLLLLRVSLFHLLRLLLMPLLQLLRSGFISLLLLHPLVVPLLLLLQFLVFLVLLGDQLFLLLLVFLILFRITRVWTREAFMRRKIPAMACIAGAGNITSCIAGPWNVVFCTGVSAWLICRAIGRRIIRRSCGFGRYHFTATERSRLRGRRDWWPAMVRRCS